MRYRKVIAYKILHHDIAREILECGHLGPYDIVELIENRITNGKVRMCSECLSQKKRVKHQILVGEVHGK